MSCIVFRLMIIFNMANFFQSCIVVRLIPNEITIILRLAFIALLSMHINFHQKYNSLYIFIFH